MQEISTGIWKMPILWRLRVKTMWHGELKRSMPKVTHRMLTLSLRELEDDGFIKGVVNPVVSQKVEYSLTERWNGSIMIISELREYGIKLMKEMGVDMENEFFRRKLTGKPNP